MESSVAMRLLDDMMMELNQVCETQSDINSKYKRLTELISDEAERRQTKFKEYWDKSLSAAWKEMHEAEKVYRQSVKRRGEVQVIAKWNVFKRKQVCFDKLLKKKKRAYHRGILMDIEKCHSKDPNSFWDYIKKLGPSKRTPIPWEVEIDGKVVTNKADILEKWCKDYAGLYQVDNDGFDDSFKERILEQEPRHDSDDSDDELNAEPTYEEVKRAVENAKDKKAPGADAIPNELLKHPNVMHLLLNLFKLCWQSGLVPDQWRESLIHPIPKSSKVSINPLDYRGLVLQSCICKILSSIINARVIRFLDTKGYIEDEQNGFCKHRSCSHHIHTLLSVAKCRILNKQDTHACFLDFRKAFDSVDRHLLYHKLKEYGISGTVLTLIKQLYQNTTNFIRLNGELSNSFPSGNGVRQGDNLSPNLFSVFINGLLTVLKKNDHGVVHGNLKINHLAYADDVVLLAETATGLQSLISVVEGWCRQWRIRINNSKSKIIHFCDKRKPVPSFTHLLNMEKLERVQSYKYLGVVLDENLTLDETVKQLSAAGSHALRQVIGKSKANLDLGLQSYRLLFDSCVAPVLDYASGAWSMGRDCPKMEQVQLRAIRYYCGLPRTTPVAGMMKEMSWILCVVRRDIENVRLYNQFIRMPPSCLNR